MLREILFLAGSAALLGMTVAIAAPSSDPGPPPPAPDHVLPTALPPAAGADVAAPPIELLLPEISELRQKIAALYGSANELAAVPYLAREMTIGEQTIRAARKQATDTQMHALIEYLDADGDVLFSLIARHPADNTLAALGLSYTSARRARFEREQFQEFSTWKAWVNQHEPTLWHSLRQAQDRFTDLSVLPSFAGNPRLDLIRQQADTIGDLERSIFNDGAPQRAFSMGSSSDIFADMGVDQFIANVNFGKVLVAYVLYDDVRSTTKKGELARGPSRYLAIVGHAGAPLAAVDLGPADAIDDLEKAFLTSISTPPTNNAPFDKRPAEQLFQKILAPLENYFKYRDFNYGTSLLISADGSLLRIPFTALVDNGTFLIDKYQIETLDSPADANLLARRNLSPSTRFLALANPSPPTVLDGKVQPLLEAEHEAEQIAALWPPGQQQILRGSDATPDALGTGATTAGIVHIAGHGRFVANPIGLLAAQTVSIDTIESDKTGLMASSLARSVIVLAPSHEPGSTGFFSALDVLGLDLSHTQLVVLAACDTGIGDQERGEGIYGLRRSFIEAGAETVVNSLWSVDSSGTREMMVSFYRNLFQGEARGEALQHAAAFTRLKYPHPYYWAAFMITGNLGGLTLPKDN